MGIPDFATCRAFERAHFTPEELMWYRSMSLVHFHPEGMSPDDSTLTAEDYPA